jgi:hypothetical protein
MTEGDKRQHTLAVIAFTPINDEVTVPTWLYSLRDVHPVHCSGKVGLVARGAARKRAVAPAYVAHSNGSDPDSPRALA